MGGFAAAPSLLPLRGHVWQPPGGTEGFAVRTRSTAAAPGGQSGQTIPAVPKHPLGPSRIFGAWQAADCIAPGGDAGVTTGPLGTARRDGRGRRG